MNEINDIEIIKQGILNSLSEHKDLIMIDDYWWSKQDIPAYNYLRRNHQGYMDGLLPHVPNKGVVVQAGGNYLNVPSDTLP